MANEAQIINNPTSTPEEVSTGYQRQNTRAEAASNGIDMSFVEPGTGQVTLKAGGPVDANSVLYSLASDVVFALTTAGQYIIYLSGTGDNLTPTITQTAGTFDPSKNAHYTAGGERILNWIITYDGTTSIAERFNDEFVERITANGTWTCLATGVYEIEMQAKGGDGGDVTGSSGTLYSGGGGGAGAYGKIRKYIESGDTWTAAFSDASAGNCTFSDGATTLTVQNGEDGTDDISGATPYGGSAGSQPSGFDENIEYQDGTYGRGFYGYGGNSKFGSFGKNIFTGDGADARGYGSGGSGAVANNIAASYTGGEGAPAIYIITKVG